MTDPPRQGKKGPFTVPLARKAKALTDAMGAEAYAGLDAMPQDIPMQAANVQNLASGLDSALTRLENHLHANGALNFSVDGWQAIATPVVSRNKDFAFTYLPPQEWAMEHSVRAGADLTRIQIKECLKLVAPPHQRKSQQTRHNFLRSPLEDPGLLSKVKRKRKLPGRAAKKSAAAAALFLAADHADAQAGDEQAEIPKECAARKQASTEEMQDLQQLPGSYRERLAGLENAGMKHAAAREKLKAKVQVAEGRLQKAERQLKEQRARAAALQVAQNDAQAASSKSQPLSEDKIVLAAIELMHKSPAHRQQLLKIGGAFSK